MPIVNIIKSIGIYALTLVLVRIFLMWWLDKYDDWPNLAPFIEGIFAFTSTAGYLEDNGGSSAEKRMAMSFVLHETAGSISQYSYCIEGFIYVNE